MLSLADYQVLLVRFLDAYFVDDSPLPFHGALKECVIEYILHQKLRRIGPPFLIELTKRDTLFIGHEKTSYQLISAWRVVTTTDGK